MKVRTFFLLVLSIFFSCNQNEEGKSLYTFYCSNCHMDDGTGLQGLIPPLAGSDFLRENPERIACIIKNGMKDSLQVNDLWYRSEMIGFSHFTDVDICNVINYINNSWGNEAPFVSPDQVTGDLQGCE